MEEVISLVDKIIEEHKTILQRMQSLEQIANDAEALAGLERAKGAFVPGRFGETEELKKFQESLGAIEEGLLAHFGREETALVAAAERYGNKQLVSTLHSLLSDHEHLKKRLDRSKEHMAELTGGNLSRHVWEATANDMRAHAAHTRRLLEEHARLEQELLHSLRSELTKAQK
jgi:iron-sulfur cluster repair protein YtfE (RIC family)